MLSFFNDVIMQLLWNPIVLHPLPCGYRYHKYFLTKSSQYFRDRPLLPGSYDTYMVSVFMLN